ncbi:transcription factor ILR3-like isoform X1 [Typha latifolia]|uniref:transcription factor ILR3-like isoform X1 n=1 Tax=Typha latifolia TaxID=4733 RepID=UPI003C2D9AFF
MGSHENSEWVLDCPLIDDAAVAAGELAASGSGLYWNPQGINGSSIPGVDINGSFVGSDCTEESGANKRARSENKQPTSKACREKMRRDKLNDRFLELGSILDPAKPLKMDKAAILVDAVRMVTELRNESQKLQDSNESLQDKIKELKAEKSELRDEKQRLKAEKESLEQQIKILSARPSFVSHPPVIPATFAAQGQATGHKLAVPVLGYPGFPMWQFMPQADVDTSQDAESCPPVA